MLEVERLSVSYGPHRALEEVSVRVAPGEICVILGANGAGKSSLLKAIAGLVRVHPGSSVRLNGREIAGARPNAVVEAGLALVPEGRGIFGDLSVAENLRLGAYGRQARNREAEHRKLVLGLFPRLAERARQTARTMSGGEQQMVAIARALMSSPTILMLDEPSLGLSPILTGNLFASLRAIRDNGVGILLVEQNARQSLAIADRGYLLENGRIVGEGRANEMMHDPAVQAAYLGGATGRPASPLPLRPMRESIPQPPSGHGRAGEREYAAAPHRARGLNGTRHVAGPSAVPAEKDMIMADDARDLAKTAFQLAERAANMHRDHIRALAGRAAAAAGSMPSASPAPGAAAKGSPLPAGIDVSALATRAARIQSEFVTSLRDAALSAARDEPDGKKGRKKRKKLKAAKKRRKDRPEMRG